MIKYLLWGYDLKKTLVIIAAGIGSRFGGGVKQLTSVDDNRHLIIDYSIHDALKAGFNKIVFVIRHDIEDDFRKLIGSRVENEVAPLGVEIVYAFQEMSGRSKPWGTGHAIYCAADDIDSPFCVINADDYYGKKSFVKASEFLGNGYALVGYVLENTLSENGSVTRGVCTVENGKLVAIDETRGITKCERGAEANGKMIDSHSLVSMNFWCYPLEFLDVIREGFPRFLDEINDQEKDEYLLPVIADQMLKEGISYSVLPTDDKWFGVTYFEDTEYVVESFRKLIKDGVYMKDLYSDILGNP